MTTECDIESYKGWLDRTYDYELHPSLVRELVATASDRSKKKIWDAMDFDNTRKDFLSGKKYPTNGQVMNVLSVLCRQSLSNLERQNAGTHGPVSDQDIHGSMCSNDCLKSDSMREMAMNVSGCNCMELSTNPGHSLFKAPGDWCGASSGTFLCEELHHCGEWTCALNDFHCRRMEYNKTYVPLKGYGRDCSSALKLSYHAPFLALVLLLFLAISK